MTMQMHMPMVMYAPTDKLTLMAMLPYVVMSMGELHRDGTRSTERSEGIGDLELRGLYSLYAAKDLRHRILANFGVGFPTGSINERDSEGERMEYPMQTGSGTFSLLPGFTYLGQALPWGWGVDFNFILRRGSSKVSIFTSWASCQSCNLWTARNCKGALSSGAVGSWNSDPILRTRPPLNTDRGENTFAVTLAANQNKKTKRKQ